MKKRVMPENDYQLFRTIASMSQDKLRSQMFAVLKKRYKTIVWSKQFVYAVGDIPVALVAHMDTVFNFPPSDIYYDTRQNVMWSPDGLGADDRAGVFAILKILQDKRHLKPSIIFTTDEEIGCLGAYALVSQYEKPLSELKFLIQLDRRGSDDCVFYDCNNLEFVDYIEQFGFKEKFGSFSDIAVICPDWGIAGVNLSVGYIDEHSISETLHVDALYDTIDKVKEILTQKNIPYFKYIPLHRFSTSGIGRYVCNCCNKIYSENEILPLQLYGEKEVNYICSDCCITKISWCPNCDMAYRLDTDEKCPICGFGMKG